MMIKLIALISKQPQISADEFQHYYESSHAPLVASLLPMIARYTRSFMPAEAEVVGKVGQANFDVLTELWFHNREDVDAFWQTIREPKVLAAIRADEANFLISERTLMFEVREHQSEFA